MSSFEDSYKSQLQGVSQQVARERLDGQVSAQDNMLSDTVTNLRRRPGATFAYSLLIPNATQDSILAWDTDLAGQQCQVVLNTVDGVIRILSPTYALLATLPASAYLVASNVAALQVATVGDEFFIANTNVKPTVGAGAVTGDPRYRGFFYIKAGAYSKTYDVRIQTAVGSFTASYTTPSGAGAGDAALAAPEYIAEQLRTQIVANYSSLAMTWCWGVRDASFVYLYSSDNPAALNLVASTPSGANYIMASGNSYIRQEADLPSRLPAGADGYIIRTGEFAAPRYYKYDTVKLAWLESGSWDSPLTITNVPVSITNIAGVWSLQTNTFEGRFAGDIESNPDPDFVRRGITGLASYQGRLVILAGSMVNLSASNKPRRFYRSTVTSILDSDCISIGASAASSAAYQYAVPFQKDLLLFSSKYQAVVPGGNLAITPRTASVVVTSTYNADMTSRPTPIGRTLMYAAPRSADFFGIMEMMPSQITEAQYTSSDSTSHLPKYLAGRCRFSVSSSVANMVLFAPTTDRNSLIVHEYTWASDQKIQQSWHKWSFKYPIASAYFSGQLVHVLFVKNGMLVACTIDPRSGANTASGDRRPYLDMSTFADVVNNVVQVPTWLQTFDPTAYAALALSVATGPMAGEPVGFAAAGTTLTTVRSYANPRVAIGFPFTSTFSPTPPMMKDGNGVKISSNKLTVLRFMVGTNNSAQYDVAVTDAATGAADNSIEGTLYFSSAELALGIGRTGADSVAIVPCRTAADSTNLVVSTSGVGELNLVSLEYVARYHEQIHRARKQNG